MDTTTTINTNVGTNPNGIPGSEVLETLVGGLRGWGLILALAAIVIAGIIWAFGAQSQNAAQATQGRRGVLIALGVAALIAAAPLLVGWAEGLGKGVT